MLNSPLPKPLHEYACILNLKLPQFCCSGDTALGKMTGILLSWKSNESSLLLISGLVVSFGLTPTKRWAQFSGNRFTIFPSSKYCGGQVAPKDIHTQDPGACEYLMAQGQKDFADQVKFMGFNIGRVSWIIWVVSKCSPEGSGSEHRSVVSNSLWPRGLYSSWNSPGQSTGVDSLSLVQGIFQPKNRTQVSRIAGRLFTSWATREAQEYWSGQPNPSPVDLPTQELNQGLLHCRRILYQLSYEGSLRVNWRMTPKYIHILMSQGLVPVAWGAGFNR